MTAEVASHGRFLHTNLPVMAGLVPAIHASAARVDPRDKPGDDRGKALAQAVSEVSNGG